MRKDKWNSAIRGQVEDKSAMKQQDQLKTFKVFNQETDEVYITTTCEVVARGKFNRMKARHGGNVKMEVSKMNKGENHWS